MIKINNKELKRIISEVLAEYGFRKVKKCFYLDLKHVSLIAMINLRHGSYVLSYNFSLNEIHDKNEFAKGNPFIGYDSILVDTVDSKEVKFFYLENLIKEDLENDIRERTKRYFDPFKMDVEKYLIGDYKRRNLTNAGDKIILLKEIKKHLGIIY